MGSKSSHFMQADRPESGGANKKDIKDKTGQHEQDKRKFESEQASLKADASYIPERGENPELTALRERRAQGEEDAQEERGAADEQA